MRVSIAKPDWGIRGGFEVVLDRVAYELEVRGHSVDWLPISVPGAGRAPFGVPVRGEIWVEAPEYFRYLSVLDEFREVTANGDLLISTQPPSFAISHPRHLSIFFHHHRAYYDLADLYLAAGYMPARWHDVARRVIRTVDAHYLDHVTRFAVASKEVESRLAHYNGAGDRIGVFQPGLAFRPVDAPSRDASIVLCVSRHEFPKRTELFVAAVHAGRVPNAVAVGVGGRARFVRWLDGAMTAGHVDPHAMTDAEMWLNVGEVSDDAVEGGPGVVSFVERIEQAHLGELYRQAICVVAPAYREDYGLTALEAMAHGAPVVVCRDGGGLTELVEHRHTGLVVDPHPAAIAAAIRELRDDPSLRASIGQNGLDVAAQFTWRRAIDQLTRAFEQVMAA